MSFMKQKPFLKHPKHLSTQQNISIAREGHLLKGQRGLWGRWVILHSSDIPKERIELRPSESHKIEIIFLYEANMLTAHLPVPLLFIAFLFPKCTSYLPTPHWDWCLSYILSPCPDPHMIQASSPSMSAGDLPWSPPWWPLWAPPRPGVAPAVTFWGPTTSTCIVNQT